MKIVHLKGPCGQFAFKGQAVLFAQRVEEIAEQLPLTIDKAGLVIVSEIKDLNTSTMKKEFSVSLPNLEAALKWLVKNNKLYKSSILNKLKLYSIVFKNYNHSCSNSHVPFLRESTLKKGIK